MIFVQTKILVLNVVKLLQIEQEISVNVLKNIMITWKIYNAKSVCKGVKLVKIVLNA